MTTSIAGDDGDFLKKARNVIYELARSGDEFNVDTLMDRLNVYGAELANELKGLLVSAVAAGLVEKTARKSARKRIMDPAAEWLETGAIPIKRSTQHYRGTDRMTGGKKISGGSTD